MDPEEPVSESEAVLPEHKEDTAALAVPATGAEFTVTVTAEVVVEAQAPL